MLGYYNRRKREKEKERAVGEEGKRERKAGRTDGQKEGKFPVFSLCQLLLIEQLLAGRKWETEKVIQNFAEC